jgi:hypothetical protein
MKASDSKHDVTKALAASDNNPRLEEVLQNIEQRLFEMIALLGTISAEDRKTAVRLITELQAIRAQQAEGNLVSRGIHQSALGLRQDNAVDRARRPLRAAARVVIDGLACVVSALLAVWIQGHPELAKPLDAFSAAAGNVLAKLGYQAGSGGLLVTISIFAVCLLILIAGLRLVGALLNSREKKEQAIRSEMRKLTDLAADEGAKRFKEEKRRRVVGGLHRRPSAVGASLAHIEKILDLVRAQEPEPQPSC